MGTTKAQKRMTAVYDFIDMMPLGKLNRNARGILIFTDGFIQIKNDEIIHGLLVFFAERYYGVFLHIYLSLSACFMLYLHFMYLHN